MFWELKQEQFWAQWREGEQQRGRLLGKITPRRRKLKGAERSPARKTAKVFLSILVVHGTTWSCPKQGSHFWLLADTSMLAVSELAFDQQMHASGFILTCMKCEFIFRWLKRQCLYSQYCEDQCKFYLCVNWCTLLCSIKVNYVRSILLVQFCMLNQLFGSLSIYVLQVLLVC